MPVRDEEMIVKTVDYLVTETVFNSQASMREIQEFMQKMATSGNASINMGDGGIRRVQLTEKTKLNDKQSREARSAIGMTCEIKVA